MNEPSAGPPTTYSEQIALLRNSKRWLRVFGYLGLIFLLTPVVLGFVFMMMLFPLSLAFARLAVVYTPAYHLMGRLLGVENLPQRLAKPPLWYAIYSAVYILFWLAVVAVMVRLLFSMGFLNQNLVYVMGQYLLHGSPPLQ